jgi:hypothetical protein
MVDFTFYGKDKHSWCSTTVGYKLLSTVSSGRSIVNYSRVLEIIGLLFRERVCPLLTG